MTFHMSMCAAPTHTHTRSQPYKFIHVSGVIFPHQGPTSASHFVGLLKFSAIEKLFHKVL